MTGELATDILEIEERRVPYGCATRLEAFFDDFYAQTFENLFVDHERIWVHHLPATGKVLPEHGPVGFEVKPGFKGRVRLSCIRSPEKGKGHASAALDWLCKLADEYGVEIEGHIEPVGDKPRLNVNQLRAWYKRHGFSVILRTNIVRFPKEGARQ